MRCTDITTRWLRLATAVILLLLGCIRAQAQYTIFEDTFDDGNWTTHPKWESVVAGPVTVSTDCSVSGAYSLKVDTNNQQGAIRAYSGLSSTTQSYESTFQMYIASMGDEAIPWCIQTSTGSVVAAVFALPNGRVQLSVVNASGTWLNSNATYTISYGAWHSFRVTYDGSTTRVYLDGHTQPDTGITQVYRYAPARIAIGNFGAAHTSRFYIDDLRFTSSTQPGRIYVQLCSDTSTGGINVGLHYIPFPELDSTYTSPDGQAAQVMAESYRNAHRDSLGNPMKFTWYMQCGSLYTYGTTTGTLLPFELMQDYHGAEIEHWGDELAYHYHTWIWNDPDGDGVYHWNQAPDFSYCLDDFDQTVAHLILDRGFYPTSFRSGWHYMDNLFQSHLDDWFPYRFENDWPAIRSDTTEPIDNVYDWSRATSAWVPYHPDPNDYQSIGSLRGWESRSRYMKSLTRANLDDAFNQALAGTNEIMTLFAHLKETDFLDSAAAIHDMLTDAHDCMPAVDFEYLTGRECMLKWRNGTDTTPPTIQITNVDANGIRIATIRTNEPIYQKQPFVAHTDASGAYSRLECTQSGTNTWQVQYRMDDTLRVAVGVTDWFGNPCVQFMKMPLRVRNVKTSVARTTAEISWETTNPADTKLDYQEAPSGPSISVSKSERTLQHKISLTDLTPGTVYRIRASGADEFSQQADGGDIYVITQLSDATVIDNVDPGFSVTGSWSTGSATTGRYGADYRYATTSPTGTSTASWTFQVQETGVYDVSSWWTAGLNRSTTAAYSVIINGVEHPKTVNQQVGGSQWGSLGIYSLTAGDTVIVRLSNAAPSGYVVIADAAAIKPAFIPVSQTGLARRLPDAVKIKLSGVAVTAAFGSELFVEQTDRSAGLRVLGSGASQNDLVDVSGELATVSGERVMINPIIDRPGGTLQIRPLGMTGTTVRLGGTDVPDVSGLLVTVWGKVQSAGTGCFYVDDGSGIDDGTGNAGIRVDGSSLSSIPSVPTFAVITGVITVETVGSRTVLLVRPRNADDCRFISL